MAESKINTYTRSSTVSLKFLNDGKKQALLDIIYEYTRVVNVAIQFYWAFKNALPKYCSAEHYKQFGSSLTAYLTQCAGKQALGIVRGTFKKQNQRIYKYEKLLEAKKYKQARKLKKIIDETNVSIPMLENIIPIEVGGNPCVLTIDLNNKTSFDGYLSLAISKGKKLEIPFKKTKHFNKMVNRGGVMASGCRIGQSNVTFTFKFEKKEIVGSTLGIDIGLKNTINASDGQQSCTDVHGHDLESICRKMARKQKGSKAFRRAQEHRKNFVNWTINQLNLDGVKEVRREDIKNLRRGINTSRLMKSWTYTDIFGKLDRYCEDQNVSVIKVSPTYTSQRCSACGYVRKSNRNGKQFKCISCGHTEDADLNAAKNIALNLRPIGTKERLKRPNLEGFYWLAEGQELIVPATEGNKR
jgi:transposase